jgi:nucleotide-binding universal stress UspA family protein
MNNVIVPIDFSETSKNAARYAAHISTLIPNAHLILYNVFDTLEYGTDSSPLGTEGEEDASRKAIVELALASVQTELTAITGASISCVAEENNRFLDTLEEYVKKNNIQLIVMGITGNTRLGQVLMGSNALNIVKRAIAPTIIVPPDAHSQSAKNVLLLTDFKDVESTIPIPTVKSVLSLFNPHLYIVNVDHEHYVQVTDEYKAQRAKLETQLKEFNPEFYFIRLFDFVEATNQFVADYKIDLILTFPRKHSFLSGMFKTSSTKQLAYHSHVPIAAINA